MSVDGVTPLAICFEDWECAVLGYAMPIGFAGWAKLVRLGTAAHACGFHILLIRNLRSWYP